VSVVVREAQRVDVTEAGTVSADTAAGDAVLNVIERVAPYAALSARHRRLPLSGRFRSHTTLRPPSLNQGESLLTERVDPGAALAQPRFICLELGAIRRADVGGLRVRLRCIDDLFGAPTRAPFSWCVFSGNHRDDVTAMLRLLHARPRGIVAGF